MQVANLVLGVDAGGTGTRCVVATVDGRVAGRGKAGGANPRSTREPVANLVAAVREALGGIDSGQVAAGVLGMAGAGKAGRERAERIAIQVWRETGLPGRPSVMGDLAVAFAAGTEARTGRLLLAGTGAAAALIRDGSVVRRCDGYGWLVGDDGSGVWIGREGVRAALAALDGRDASTVLSRTIPGALVGADNRARCAAEGDDSIAQAIVAAVHSGEPARLATLAPLVDDAARQGDEVAQRIITEATRLLLRSVAALGVADGDTPLVLAGSLLVQPTYLAGRMRAALSDHDSTEFLVARDGAAGAAALALRRLAAERLDPDDAQLQAAHRALLTDGAGR
jgi:N-acetylglucosamine kinase-like BadF-type ATPase